MAHDSFKYLKEHRKKRRAENKKLRQLSDEELVAIATVEDDFLPIPEKKTIPQRRGRPLEKKPWLAQNGIVSGKTKIESKVLRFVLLKAGLVPSEIEYIIKYIMRPTYDCRHGYYNLKLDFFKPHIDYKNIVKFGDRVMMSLLYYPTFKEEYEAAIRKEKEEKAAAKKV